MTAIIIVDPRSTWPAHHRFPEDGQDGALWSKLLTLARQRSPQLARNLRCFRIEGTRIVKLRNGNFGLRPVIRPRGSEKPEEGWESMEDYKRYAKKFLAPWHNTLVELLEELKEAAEAGNEEERQIALEI